MSNFRMKNKIAVLNLCYEELQLYLVIVGMFFLRKSVPSAFGVTHAFVSTPCRRSAVVKRVEHISTIVLVNI